MIAIDRLTIGMRIDDLHPSGRVEVTDVRTLGPKAMLKVRDGYGVGHTLIVGADDLATANEVRDPIGTLDADPARYALAVEAQRILHAHLLNPLLALTTANVEPLPHQIQAVYDHLVQPGTHRFLLADDPGAGKTIMAGLYIREALARGWVRSVIVVAPGSLVDQWRDELLTKFGLDFGLLEGTNLDTSPFTDKPFLIARLDVLSRNPQLQEHLAAARYDLAIVDEAHKMSARTWGSKILTSRRYQLGETLRDSVDRLVLMTATPHNGKDEDFDLFLRLLGTERSIDEESLLHTGLMRRLVKEQLVHADGTALFPKRHAKTVAYRLSPLEHDLYEAVTDYVRHEMNKVTGDERRTVGFALLVLQRRLASSPEAILRSLIRRRDRLTTELQHVQASDDRLVRVLEASLGRAPEGDTVTPDVEEQWDDNAASVATTARSAAELETEVRMLGQLVDKATAVRDADLDSKWEALADLLASDAMFDVTGSRRKIIIFTEHRDTLDYLVDRLLHSIGNDYDVEAIHGGTIRDERLAVQRRFKESERSAVLVATDSAGEGVNLQAAHLMVNYDIPWNPNRLEQRFGRIHRIGQRHECHLWNLVTADTREGDVFATLLAKLERQRNTLGDCVFDVLGDVLRDSKLSDLLTDAVTGTPGRPESGLASFDHDMRDAVTRRSAHHTDFTPDQIADLRRRMALARARSLNPHTIQQFVNDALLTYHGDITHTSAGWSVRHVPERVRREHPAVRTRYADIEFQTLSDAAAIFGARELLAPGHPLVTALAQAVVSDHGGTLRRGVVLEDDRTDKDHIAIWTARNSDHQTLLAAFLLPGTEPGSPTPLNPGALSALPAAATRATGPEILAINDAITATAGLPGDCELVAVAYIRGTATPETADRWRQARKHGRARGQAASDEDVVAHDPWDWFAERDGIWTFTQARPTGVSTHLRAHERAAVEALGPAFATINLPVT